MDLVLVPGVNNHAGSFGAMCAHMPLRHPTHVIECDAVTDVDVIAARILAQAPPRCAVLGHSFGGHVALAMAASMPDRIAGLVLVNSGDWPDTPEMQALREQRASLCEEGGYADLASAASARAYHPDNVGRADLLAEREAAITAYGPVRFAAHQRAMAARPDRRGMLLARNFPMLVVAADCDVVIPTQRQVEMADAVAAELAIIPGAGHMLPVEQPAALAAAVCKWLDAIEQADDRRNSDV